jgi:putative flippase GtrA
MNSSNHNIYPGSIIKPAPKGAHWFRFFKFQVTSFTASVVDFLLTVLLVEIAGLWYLFANIIGVISGGTTNFILNKSWTFQSRNVLVHKQAVRYFHVWTGSLILNTLGMYLLTSLLNIDYIISKVFVSFSVGLGFNYPMQKKYVFADKI